MKKEIEKFADKLVDAYKKNKLISPLPIKYTKNIKYIKSNTESAINRFENDFVNVAARRFPTKTQILKMLPIMFLIAMIPMHW